MNPLFKVAIISALLEVVLMVLAPVINLSTLVDQYYWIVFIVIGVVGVICGVIGAIGVVLGM